MTRYRLERLLDEDAGIQALLDVLPMDSSAPLDGSDPLADNARRASFAALALETYAEVTGQLHYEQVATVLGDLLNDLHHLCDASGLDFDDIAAVSYNYEAEIRGVL